jgi:filamentous hemagglutinin family protein
MTIINIILFALCLLPVAHAEVITDGSLGSKVELPGRDFQITPELGQQVGGNLFHSFQNFNLSEGESATFSGANSVQNIIARVTGGQASTIDGMLRSTIPNADLYFLNPYGILFGKNAQLDLQGGFHASTADYLKLQDGGRFDARQLNNSLLTIAPVQAFGFLDTPSNIETQDNHLAVAPHTEFSLIGGNLTLNHTELTAESGRINLVSVASSGETTAKRDRLDARVPDTSSFSQLGQLQMTETQVDTSGSPAGGISIRGGQLLMNNSLLHAHNYGSDPGMSIDIELRDLMSMTNEYTSEAQPTDHAEAFGITSDTFATGNAGHVTITVPRLEMRQNVIDVSTKGEGAGGNIDIQTQQMSLGEGAQILSNSYSAGAGGEINIKATERLELIDQRVFATEEEVDKNRNTSIQTDNFSSGDGGNITIDAPYLRMSGGYIFSNTIAQGQGGTIMINSQFMELLNGSGITAVVLPQATGNSGEIKLNVSDTLSISGFRPGFVREGGVIVQNLQSGIGPVTAGNGKSGLLEITAKNLIISDYASVGSATIGIGDAGGMTISVDNLYLQGGGILTNSSSAILGGKLWLATGNGGNLTVTATGDIVIEGSNPFNPSSISTNTFLSGQGGNIDLQANRLILRDGGAIVANSLGTGNAGNVHINANEIHLSNGGEITSAAVQAVGGNIVINTPYLLNLQQGQITTSVHNGIGHGGNITIEQPQFVVLNQGKIIAQADAGQGGNIHLIAQHFIPSVESLVSASSNLGIDGQVTISSPTEDVGNQVLNLSANYLNAASLFPRSCAARIADQRPSEFVRPFTFIVKPQTAAPAPEDTRGSPYPVTMLHK